LKTNKTSISKKEKIEIERIRIEIEIEKKKGDKPRFFRKREKRKKCQLIINRHTDNDMYNTW
jgi:uncharacterized OsmC-like protein